MRPKCDLTHEASCMQDPQRSLRMSSPLDLWFSEGAQLKRCPRVADGMLVFNKDRRGLAVAIVGEVVVQLARAGCICGTSKDLRRCGPSTT